MAGIVAAAIGAVRALVALPFAAFRELLEAVPGIRLAVSYGLWYPTLAFNRLVYVIFPGWRPMYSLVDPENRLILGAVPLFVADVTALHGSHGVTAVLNMCYEWEDHVALYESLGVRYHRERVIDYTVPSREQLLRAARFVDQCVTDGRTLYCHCKAGKGRSTCALLAYYLVFAGASPEAAWTAMKKRRHVGSRCGHSHFGARQLRSSPAVPHQGDALDGPCAMSSAHERAALLGSDAEPKSTENRPAAWVADPPDLGPIDFKAVASASGVGAVGIDQGGYPDEGYQEGMLVDEGAEDYAYEDQEVGQAGGEAAELGLADTGVTIWQEFQTKRDLKAAPSIGNVYLLLGLSISIIWLGVLAMGASVPWQLFAIDVLGLPSLAGVLVAFVVAKIVASDTCTRSPRLRPCKLSFGRVTAISAGVTTALGLAQQVFVPQMIAFVMGLNLQDAYRVTAGQLPPDPDNSVQVQWASRPDIYFRLRSRAHAVSPESIASVVALPVLMRMLMLRQIDYTLYTVALVVTTTVLMLVRAFALPPEWRPAAEPWSFVDETFLIAATHVGLVIVALLVVSFQLVSQREEQAWAGFVQRKRLQLQAIRAEELLTLAMPRQIAHRLMAGELDQRLYDSASVGFIYIAGYKDLVYEANEDLLGLVDDLHQLYCRFDALVLQHDAVYKIESVANCYMVAAGIPDPCEDHAPALLRFCLAALELCRLLRHTDPDLDWRLKIGIHSGPVTSGVVGLSRTFYRLFGDTVNTASRMGTRGDADRVHVSRATYELLGEPPVVNPELEGSELVPLGTEGEELGRHFVFGKVGGQLSLLVLPPEETLLGVDDSLGSHDLGSDSDYESEIPLLGYTVEARGEIPVKGKGMMRTYFVDLPPGLWDEEDFGEEETDDGGATEGGDTTGEGVLAGLLSPPAGMTDDETSQAGGWDMERGGDVTAGRGPGVPVAASPSAELIISAGKGRDSGGPDDSVTSGRSGSVGGRSAVRRSSRASSRTASLRRMTSSRRVTGRARPQRGYDPTADSASADPMAGAVIQRAVSRQIGASPPVLGRANGGGDRRAPGMAVGPTMRALAAIGKLRRRRASQAQNGAVPDLTPVSTAQQHAGSPVRSPGYAASDAAPRPRGYTGFLLTPDRAAQAAGTPAGMTVGRGSAGKGSLRVKGGDAASSTAAVGRGGSSRFHPSPAGSVTSSRGGGGDGVGRVSRGGPRVTSRSTGLTLDLDAYTPETSTRQLLAAASMRRPPVARSSSTPRRGDAANASFFGQVPEGSSRGQAVGSKTTMVVSGAEKAAGGKIRSSRRSSSMGRRRAGGAYTGFGASGHDITSALDGPSDASGPRPGSGHSSRRGRSHRPSFVLTVDPLGPGAAQGPSLALKASASFAYNAAEQRRGTIRGSAGDGTAPPGGSPPVGGGVGASTRERMVSDTAVGSPLPGPAGRRLLQSVPGPAGGTDVTDSSPSGSVRCR